MRVRALVGGIAIVAVVTLWHRPSSPVANGSASPGLCDQAGGLCSAFAGLSQTLHQGLPVPHAGILPPPSVPGAIDPRVTQANINETICRPSYALSMRPAYVVTGPLKRRMMDAQHPGEAMADYELDHLIPISIGGAPLDARDLWLQSRQGRANAGDKNALAYVLWRLVCTGQVPLATAQAAISEDWTKAYVTYATPENLARYHFRHGPEERD